LLFCPTSFIITIKNTHFFAEIGDDMDLAQIGGVLRAERKKLGKSLEQIANELSCGASTISSIERGILNVSEEKRIAYAKAVGMGSLFGIVEEAEKRINRLRHKLEIIEEIVFANPKEALKKLAHLNNEEKIEYIGVLRPFVHYLKGRANFVFQNWETAEKYFRYCIETIEKHPELVKTNFKSYCYNGLGVIRYLQGDYKKALKQTTSGLDNFKATGERTYNKLFLLLNKSIYLDGLEKYEESLKTLDDLNHYITTAPDQDEIRISLKIKMYTLYTNTLDKLGMPQKALKYARCGEKIADTNHEIDSLFMLWSQIGAIYLKLEELKLAEEYFAKALDIKSKVIGRHLIPFAFKHFATLLMIKNDWDFAKEIIDQSIEISKNQKDDRKLAESLVSSAKWCMRQNQFEEAIDLYLQAEKIAELQPTKSLLAEITADLCFCYEKINNLEMFQSYSKKYFWLSYNKDN
jgi:tetratricopeptide (TPR) repeat protein